MFAKRRPRAADWQSQPFGAYSPRGWLRYIRRHAMVSAGTRGSKNALSTLLRRHADVFGGVYDLEYRGHALRVFPGENACDNWIFRSGLHPEEVDFEALNRFHGQDCVFVDIGANVGLYTLHMAGLLGDGARIVSIEPHPDTFRKLSFNIDANRVANVSRLERAVGSAPGTAPLFIRRGQNAGQNTLRTQTGRARSVDVRVDRLSDLLSEAGVMRPDILKIDVEGVEDTALIPYLEATATEQWPDYFIIEIAQRPLWTRDCVDEICAKGYEVAFASPLNLHLIRQG